MGRLEEIEARVQATTEGPWEQDYVDEGAYSIYSIANGYEQRHQICFGDQRPLGLRIDPIEPFKAEFISHARADTPWLLAEVRRLREGLAEIAEGTHECTHRLIAQEMLDGQPI